jgi:hypothetical protein
MGTRDDGKITRHSSCHLQIDFGTTPADGQAGPAHGTGRFVFNRHGQIRRVHFSNALRTGEDDVEGFIPFHQVVIANRNVNQLLGFPCRKGQRAGDGVEILPRTRCSIRGLELDARRLGGIAQPPANNPGRTREFRHPQVRDIDGQAWREIGTQDFDHSSEESRGGGISADA